MLPLVNFLARTTPRPRASGTSSFQRPQIRFNPRPQQIAFPSASPSPSPSPFPFRSTSSFSSPPRGKLTLESLKKEVEEGRIDTVVVAFSDPYGRLVGKRLDADFFLEETSHAGTHACEYLFTVDMDMNVVDGFQFASWNTGFGDVHMVPDLGTLRVASWLDSTAMVICDVVSQKTHKPLDIAPRNILKKQVELAQKKFGMTPFAATELEYYLFDTPYSEIKKEGLHKPAGWYVEDYHLLQGARNEHFHGEARRQLKQSGISVEGSKGEAGIGQHELNVKYDKAVEMGDTHSVYKQCLKELADKMGLSLTFMAKPFQQQSGSGCHIHFNLRKEENGKSKSVFYHPTNQWEGISSTPEFRWFMGGWIKHTPELMPFYAPTINSYKRFVASSWAPTRLAAGKDNRTAGFRVVGSKESLRIENRIPGADCNPYLALAASLASGLDGIENKIEPPPLLQGDVYSAQNRNIAQVPTSLRDSVELFKKSDFVRRTFGEQVVNHYSHFYEEEIRQFDKSVTDWEVRRYFEQI